MWLVQPLKSLLFRSDAVVRKNRRIFPHVHQNNNAGQRRSRDCIYYCKLQADWVQYKAVFKSQHGVLDYHTAAFLTFSLFLVKSSYLFTLWMEIWAGDIAITSSVIALHYVTFDRILDSRVLAFSPPLFHFFFSMTWFSSWKLVELLWATSLNI